MEIFYRIGMIPSALALYGRSRPPLFNLDEISSEPLLLRSYLDPLTCTVLIVPRSHEGMMLARCPFIGSPFADLHRSLPKHAIIILSLIRLHTRHASRAPRGLLICLHLLANLHRNIEKFGHASIKAYGFSFVQVWFSVIWRDALFRT